MANRKVKCISSLGQTFDAILINPDLKEVPKKHLEFFKRCGGIDKYALVKDIEYGCEVIKKWGYDCFTVKEYNKKFK